MRIIIEDDKPDARSGKEEEIIQRINKIISDHMMSLDQLYERIEEIEVNLKMLDQRIREFESVPSVDEDPDLHTDL